MNRICRWVLYQKIAYVSGLMMQAHRELQRRTAYKDYLGVLFATELFDQGEEANYVKAKVRRIRNEPTVVGP
jgi:hypothetical protein